MGQAPRRQKLLIGRTQVEEPGELLGAGVGVVLTVPRGLLVTEKFNGHGRRLLAGLAAARRDAQMRKVAVNGGPADAEQLANFRHRLVLLQIKGLRGLGFR